MGVLSIFHLSQQAKLNTVNTNFCNLYKVENIFANNNDFVSKEMGQEDKVEVVR